MTAFVRQFFHLVIFGLLGLVSFPRFGKILKRNSMPVRDRKKQHELRDIIDLIDY